MKIRVELVADDGEIIAKQDGPVFGSGLEGIRMSWVAPEPIIDNERMGLLGWELRTWARPIVVD